MRSIGSARRSQRCHREWRPGSGCRGSSARGLARSPCPLGARGKCYSACSRPRCKSTLMYAASTARSSTTRRLKLPRWPWSRRRPRTCRHPWTARFSSRCHRQRRHSKKQLRPSRRQVRETWTPSARDRAGTQEEQEDQGARGQTPTQTRSVTLVAGRAT